MSEVGYMAHRQKMLHTLDLVYVKIFNKEKLRALVKMQLTRNQPKTRFVRELINIMLAELP